MMGAALARQFASAGHSVKLANSRGPETIADLASQLDVTAVSMADLLKDAEVIVVSIPQGAIERLPEGLFDDAPSNAVIIDTGNYYPELRDQAIGDLDEGLPESVWVSRRIGRPVIKAFNSISFTSLANAGKPAGTPGRVALPVAGDDPAAKMVAEQLLDDIGFDAVDAGSLHDSWRQQPGTPVYCTDLDKEGVAKALSMAERDRAPERRDQFIAQMLRSVRAGEAIDLIALGRSIYGAPCALNDT